MADALKVQTVDEVREALAAHDYLADEGLATAIFLALRLQPPLLLEGEAGVGKTEVAKVLARWTGGELLRLQCYEGIDVAQAVYEWDYSRQLLHLRAVEAGRRWRGPGRRGRAVLRAVPRAPPAAAGDRLRRRGPPPVLLIDEVDRADDEFEAFLLEILSDYSVTVPELGTFQRRRAPDRGRHVEPHPRRARRAEASLPLPLGRAPRLRARGRHPARLRAPEVPRGARPPGGGGRRGRCGTSSSTSRPAWPRRSTGRMPLAALGRTHPRRAHGRGHPRHRPQVPRGPGAGARATGIGATSSARARA